MSQGQSTDDHEIRRLGDIVAQIAGPVLTMLAVSSVAFFLIEVTYTGGFVGRVKWIFGLFSFAAVLVSRISIEEGYERANGFGFLLGLATIFVAARFMQGNIIGLTLILLFVWWIAGRLTWDCTFFDKTRDASGQGMIDLAIDRFNRFRSGKVPNENLEDGFDGQAHRYAELTQPLDSKGQTKKPTAWDNFVRIFFRRRQANTPGLWAFYFLLAGLPLFGIGQIFLGITNSQGQGAAVWHFSMYIIALLGLLMLTSILGLHRYLKANQSAMPASIARKWIFMGTLLALTIVGFCWLLPRPTPQYSLSRWLPKFNSNNLAPSENSFGQDGQQQGENSNVNSGPKNRNQQNQQGNDSGDENGGGNRKKSDSGAPQDTDGGESSGGNAEGEQGSGGDKKESSKSSGNKDSRSRSKSSQQEGGEKKGQQSGEKSGNDNGASKSQNKDKSGPASDEKGNKKNGMRSPDKSRKSKKSQKDDRAKNKNSSSSSNSSSSGNKSNKSNESKQSSDSKSSPPRNSAMDNFVGLIRSIFMVIFLAVLAFFLIKYRSQVIPWIQSFLAELAGFWARLFGSKKKKKVKTSSEPVADRKSKRKLAAFPSYRDPFASGKADSWSSERLITYSMEALEAWARDQGSPREPDQTAVEFASQLAKEYKPLEQEAKLLANLYTQLAYAKGKESGIARHSVLELSALWNKLAGLYSSVAEAVPA